MAICGLGEELPLRTMTALFRCGRFIASARQSVSMSEEGEIVTTGTLTRSLPGRPGEPWQASFDGLPLDMIEIELA